MPSKRMLFLSGVSDLALVLWAGATWAAGYVFAPALFAHFPRELAGDAAGQVFAALNVLALACAALILLDLRVRYDKQLQHQRELWAVVGLVFVVLIQYIGLAPKMAALKLLFPDAQAETTFGQLHGFSQVLFLLQSGTLAYLVYQRFARKSA
ncbi:hypothetical protein DTO96_102064 [Ephemeroptericola cinctiostellae]|uniref:TMEM205-like domain-containing protein n=2 Tax=Ephemeroptericola cinctiostellae TaxID=2268024 RepID=A0A345DD79_9BURK|nr:hypothetical protein DTO96_102064 [Ephemeroptericola cinctiostellae]